MDVPAFQVFVPVDVIDAPDGFGKGLDCQAEENGQER
jgi:hypothetical protein